MQEVFQRLKSSSWTPAWVRETRERAFQDFQALGWPTRQDENWKYTSTKALAETAFAWNELPQEAGSPVAAKLEEFFLEGAYVLVFVNGRLSAGLSRLPESEGVRFAPLEEALEHPSPRVRDFLTPAVAGSMEALNLAFFNSGYLLHLEPGVKIEKPFQILYVNSNKQAEDAAELICPRSLILLEENAEATVVESYFSYLEGHFTNSVTRAYAGKNAQLRMSLEKVLSSQSQHLSQTFCELERDARVHTFTLNLGGRLSRTEQSFKLLGEGSYAQFDGLYIGRGQSHIDNHTEVQHIAAHTKSSQVFKGILHDKSRAVFDGRINIVKNAQGSAAQQLNKNLLMSETAEIDTKPQLQIDADDVRCSHGATVGRLDRDELFYLQSRGIPRAEGEIMLSKAFVRDVISRINKSPIEQRLERLLVQYGGMEV